MNPLQGASRAATPAKQCGLVGIYNTMTLMRKNHFAPIVYADLYCGICNLQQGSNQFDPKVIESGVVSNETTSIDRNKAANLAGVGHATISRAKEVVNKGDDSLVKAVESGKLSISAGADLTKSVPDKDEQRQIIEEVLPQAKNKVEAKRLIDEQVEQRKATNITEGHIKLSEWKPGDVLAIASDKRFNTQKKDSIGWAAYSWNPVTGCNHGCEYCYARDIAERFYGDLGFNVAIHPDRMLIPLNNHPKAPNNRVFTCSMSDLFAAEVPREWIDEVLRVCKEAAHFDFLLLTKFPKRLEDFDFPDNCWIGTSCDTQRRLEVAAKIMPRVNAAKKWLSIEPMLERMEWPQGFAIDWIAVGGASKNTQQGGFVPPWEWVFSLSLQAKNAGAKVWIKDNFWSPGRPMEF